ncbi:MAG: hypothetical protein AAF416_11735 [Pseudomonadota bacterium]
MTVTELSSSRAVSTLDRIRGSGRILFSLAAALLLAIFSTSAHAVVFNEGDSFSRDFRLDSVPPEPIFFVTTLIEFTDDGIVAGEELSLALSTAGGDPIFSNTITSADAGDTALPDVGFTSAEKTEPVDPDLLTGRDYSFTLTALAGSFNITSFKFEFFGRDDSGTDPGSGGAPGDPFGRNPTPGIVWGNGDAFEVVPLPLPMALLLTGLGAMALLRRRPN